jgi:hypothetical protein
MSELDVIDYALIQASDLTQIAGLYCQDERGPEALHPKSDIIEQ